jgi:hypothetical protein
MASYPCLTLTPSPFVAHARRDFVPSSPPVLLVNLCVCAPPFPWGGLLVGHLSAWASPSPSRPLAALGPGSPHLCYTTCYTTRFRIAYLGVAWDLQTGAFDPGLGSFAEARVSGVVEAPRRAVNRD